VYIGHGLVHSAQKGRPAIAIALQAMRMQPRLVLRLEGHFSQRKFGMAKMARLHSRETKRGWPATALLGILCLLAPAGLAAPALFVFLLVALAVMAESG
jgi:hypothetical protein